MEESAAKRSMFASPPPSVEIRKCVEETHKRLEILTRVRRRKAAAANGVR
jgi:hypothetical protein